MPSQESTAINDLIHLVQGRRLERASENPVPEVYIPAPRPEASLRVASGTRPPPIAQPAVPIAPRTAQKKVYRLPVVEQDEEQTELWHNANVDTAPAVPSIAPHAATVIATPHAPVVPAILQGPISPENPVDRAAAARAAQHAAEERARAAARAAHPSQHHSRAMPAATMAPSQPSPSITPLSQLPYPAFAIPVAPPAPAKRASPASWLIAREVLTSWGTLAMIAVVALGIGIYAAIATAEEPAKVAAPTERDRAIAIMNGTAQPEPAHTVVHAPAPSEAPAITTPRPAPFDTVAPTTEITAEPIDEESSEPPLAATDDEPAADEIDPDAIEIEIEPMNARPSKRAVRRAARKAKRLAKASTVIVAAKPSARRSRRNDDPVLAILNEKPAKQSKRSKKVKESSGPATAIAAPKGALAAKGTGKVTITSDVAAMIYLDGRPTGRTAPTALVIPAGDHQITLLDPASKKAKTATVQLAANKAVAIRKDFR